MITPVFSPFTTMRPGACIDPGERESRFRLRLAAALGVLQFLTTLGLIWDERWHLLVGRDGFFTPAHLVIYSGVALVGLIALAVVLIETIRYYRRDPAVNDRSTTRVLGLFHAPLGMTVIGFGMFTLLLAAPLDNYWHELYGIDVALWAPFHVMGLLGGLIACAGGVHFIASEAARARARDRGRFFLFGLRGSELATMVAAASLLTLLLNAIQPAALQFPTTWLGSLEIQTYPVLLAAILTLIGVTIVSVLRQPGAATLTGLLFVLQQFVFAAVAPWLIWWTITSPAQLRVPDWSPSFSPTQTAISLAFVLPLLLIDVAFAIRSRRPPTTDPGRRRPRSLTALAGAAGALLAAPVLVNAGQAVARRASLPVAFRPAESPGPESFLAAIPVAIVVAFLAAGLGTGWGGFLRNYEQ